jgi:hypothetical protein
VLRTSSRVTLSSNPRNPSDPKPLASRQAACERYGCPGVNYCMYLGLWESGTEQRRHRLGRNGQSGSAAGPASLPVLGIDLRSGPMHLYPGQPPNTLTAQVCHN